VHADANALSIMALQSEMAERMLAIVNARVWTGDEHRPWADAVLVRGSRVAGVGSSAEIRKRAGASARIIDAKAMMVLPADAAGRIASGFPASLIVVERAMDASAQSPRTEEIVLALDEGIVTVDRDSLAG
jgi:predicted amidohydrolase YtcJ